MEEKNVIAPVKERKVALIGNPNSGKSTLFNVLTGLNQRTGNFPGVTVDKKTGTVKMKNGSRTVNVHYTDLPGTYSLYPKSLDEEVATRVLTDEKNEDHPELVVIVADSTNLKRGLFLTGQVIDFGLPCILVLNMIDEAEKAGLQIDANRLSNRLGIPVVKVSARQKTGIEKLEELISGEIANPAYHFIDASSIAAGAVKIVQQEEKLPPGYIALHRTSVLFSGNETWRKKLEAAGFNPAAAQAEETLMRYGVIGQHIEACTGVAQKQPAYSSKIDKVLTHKFWGYIIFLVIMMGIFQTIFFLAEYPMSWIEDGFMLLRSWCAAHMPAGMLTDLVVNGILAGLSGVVVFIPQIALLFFFIAMLEDSGYMARVSFIMDKLMRRIGLHGRSVIPLMSGMACAVPAIMTTRTISNWKERLITIMVTPFMSCSARLPVYTLIISLIVPGKMVWGIFQMQGLALMAMYVLGFLTAIVAAWVLSKIVKVKEKSWFIMELPVYRMPKWSNVFYTIFEKVKVFLFDAGKVIVAIAVILWLLASYGPGDKFKQNALAIESLRQHAPFDRSLVSAAAQKKVAQFHNDFLADQNKWQDSLKQLESKKLELSYAGYLGKWIEPVIRPLGYDWKIGISLITSLAAREVFVGTMATIYGAGDEDNTQPIREVMRKEKNPETGLPVYTLATGISIMIFYAFALQCMSTLAVVRRETNSWKWPVIQFSFMGILAYVASLVVYQVMK